MTFEAEKVKLIYKSPSSRRAWIEIITGTCNPYKYNASPSSRRAWIEIFLIFPTSHILGSRPPRGGRG